MNFSERTKSLDEINASVKTDYKSSIKKFFAFLGPAYLISVGYMDPGNWATDIAGGSSFGYSLLWVLLMSNLMAILLQSHSARLGIVSGLDLAQANRVFFPTIPNFFLYLLAEVAIIACDLAEVIGMAIGIHLLFPSISLLNGILITVIDSFLLLYLMNKGIRKLEAFIFSLVFVISVSFLIEIILVKPSAEQVLSGFVPNIVNEDALYIAIGIIGATVMPHNLYLHSSLVQTRKIDRSKKGVWSALKYSFADSVIALNIAFLVNAFILIVAATVFFKNNIYNVDEIQQAHRLLENILGNKLAPILFAVALIAAGQSSTITGTLAGQIIMEGYLNLRLNPVVRRIITRALAIIPAALTVIFLGEEKISNLLIFSQVVLSLQLGFAIIPLIHFVSNKKLMGEFVIPFWQKILSWIVVAIILILNLKMVFNEVANYLLNSNHPLMYGMIFIPIIVGCLILLMYILIVPALYYHPKEISSIHGQFPNIDITTNKKEFKTIAVSVDFSTSDNKALNYALQLSNSNTELILIHIIDNVGSIVYQHQDESVELKSDTKFIERYCEILSQKGVKCRYILGFGSPKKELPKIVHQINADILIMGAHGHKTIKDILLGTTIDEVRHSIKIPLLVV
ncbi:MAG TPA: Nramp family divalent metal transporter [Bacteroidia bacterium]|nr:Nramp family divalent metal transporter [Bacteroidia bacterium]